MQKHPKKLRIEEDENWSSIKRSCLAVRKYDLPQYDIELSDAQYGMAELVRPNYSTSHSQPLTRGVYSLLFWSPSRVTAPFLLLCFLVWGRWYDEHRRSIPFHSITRLCIRMWHPLLDHHPFYQQRLLLARRCWCSMPDTPSTASPSSNQASTTRWWTNTGRLQSGRSPAGQLGCALKVGRGKLASSPVHRGEAGDGRVSREPYYVGAV